jgi:hypothetical protein
VRGVLPAYLARMPDISIPTPDISIPSLPLPDISLPGWVQTVLSSAKYWVPVLVGIVLALNELQKRNKVSS